MAEWSAGRLSSLRRLGLGLNGGLGFKAASLLVSRFLRSCARSCCRTTDAVRISIELWLLWSPENRSSACNTMQMRTRLQKCLRGRLPHGQGHFILAAFHYRRAGRTCSKGRLTCVIFVKKRAAAGPSHLHSGFRCTGSCTYRTECIIARAAYMHEP